MGKKVLVGGVFSLLHPGHIFFLKAARKLGSSLVVVVAHDTTVNKKKGKPVFTAKERKEMVESLKFVSKVRIGHASDMMRVVREEKPNIIALGFDQEERELKEDLKELGLKCRISRIKELPGYSTSRIVTEIRKTSLPRSE